MYDLVKVGSSIRITIDIMGRTIDSCINYEGANGRVEKISFLDDGDCMLRVRMQSRRTLIPFKQKRGDSFVILNQQTNW